MGMAQYLPCPCEKDADASGFSGRLSSLDPKLRESLIDGEWTLGDPVYMQDSKSSHVAGAQEAARVGTPWPPLARCPGCGEESKPFDPPNGDGLLYDCVGPEGCIGHDEFMTPSEVWRRWGDTDKEPGWYWIVAPAAGASLSARPQPRGSSKPEVMFTYYSAGCTSLVADDKWVLGPVTAPMEPK
jgi:hypothetical protein